MRKIKYILALMVGSLALLAGAQLELAPVQADPPAKPVERTKRAPTPKPKPRRAIPVDLKAVAPPPGTTYVVVHQIPAATNPIRAKGRPYLDLEGLVLGDMHVQPNLILGTDSRYDNSSTREHAQRDELDFLAARQHGEARGPDPLSELLRTRAPVYPGCPGNNDPGYGVAVAIRQQLHSPGHKVAPTPPSRATPNSQPATMKMGALPAPLRPAKPAFAAPHRALPARLFGPQGGLIGVI